MTFPKDGKLQSPAFLGWVRKQPCRWCEDNGASKLGGEAHHYPPKGMGGGRVRDDRTIPLCRKHHDLAQRYEVPHEVQRVWAMETRDRFLERADLLELRLYLRDLERWRARPLAEDIPS